MVFNYFTKNKVILPVGAMHLDIRREERIMSVPCHENGIGKSVSC